MSENQNTNGVSRNALAIARMVDRLPPGKFTIYLAKSEGESDRWIVEIAQPVTLQKKELSDSERNKSMRTEVQGEPAPV
jgi:hypothetical protein